MRHILFLFVFIFPITGLVSQHMSYTQQDLNAFEAKIGEIKNMDVPSNGQAIVAVGTSFRGLPYEGKTLEINQDEKLVINLRAFDCTTFVENVLAFTLLHRKEAEEFEAFGSILQNIRYRDGELAGYPSRLHYFTDWLKNNEQKGLIRNISCELGGLPFTKKIHFMTSHRELYPGLQEKENFERIKMAEDRLSEQEFCYIPQQDVKKVEDLIRDGDIIAMATAVEGLDVTHTGFAYRKTDGKVYLLHASASGAVEVSKQPLAEYLKGIKYNIGILVARPL